MKFLIFLLLTSCAPLNFPPSTHYINVVNKKACSNFDAAKEYLASKQVKLIENIAASKTFVCLPTPHWLLMTFSPIQAYGVSDNTVAWGINRKSVIIHELAHLLFGMEHSLELLPVGL